MILVADLICSIGCFNVDRNFFEKKNVFTEFFEFNCICFDIAKYSIEIVFIDTKKMRIILV